jgi:hypothetical protein
MRKNGRNGYGFQEEIPARVKCAILFRHAVMAALKGDAKPENMENDQT